MACTWLATTPDQISGGCPCPSPHLCRVTIADVSLARCILPEVVLTLGVVPTLDYDTTGTDGLAGKVGDAILKHDAVLMDRHGAVCVGKDLMEAFCRLETMEHTALITKTAIDLGGVKELPPEEAIKLRSMGLKRYGGPPSAVKRRMINMLICHRPAPVASMKTPRKAHQAPMLMSMSNLSKLWQMRQ